MVTNSLKWNISLCTVFEIFDQLMVRAPDLEYLRESFCNIAYSIQIGKFFFSRENSAFYVLEFFVTNGFLPHFLLLAGKFF